MFVPLNAEFITSSSEVGQCPEPRLPEYAFVGRSNVGKSSLINMITGKKMLAKTSSTPGKTQLINHFLVDGTWYLVDLPGYGFARTSCDKRSAWEKLIRNYLMERTNLMSTFLLVDARLPMQAIDRQVINWFGEHEAHFVLVFTKTDKLTVNQLAAHTEAYKKELLKDWESLPPMVLTSAKTSAGRQDILRFIGETNRLFLAPSDH